MSEPGLKLVDSNAIGLFYPAAFLNHLAFSSSQSRNWLGRFQAEYSGEIVTIYYWKILKVA
jgi:hypothetical protein